MKTLLALFLLLLPFSCLAAEKEDPIVGKWRWYHTEVIHITADGRMSASGGATGTWEYLKNKEAERKYKLQWGENAKFISDMVTLSRNSNQLSGKSSVGVKVSGTRIAQ